MLRGFSKQSHKFEVPFEPIDNSLSARKKTIELNSNIHRSDC